MIRYALATAFLVCATASAQAALITSAPSGGTTTVFTPTGLDSATSPDTAMIDGFEVTGTPFVSFGDTSYGLATNGRWSPVGSPFSWVAVNSGFGSMTVNLGGAFSAAGFFMNYAIRSGLPDGATR